MSKTTSPWAAKGGGGRTLRWWIGCVASLCLTAGSMAAAAETGDALAGARVGSLGSPEALVFEGNRSYSRNQILKGLSAKIDFHLAAHPAAPLDAYATALERMVVLGYRHGGFPDATAQVSLPTNGSPLRLTVNEGSRYRCGEVLLAGSPAMTNEAVRKAIVLRLSGIEPATGTTNKDDLLWKSGEWAPLDDYTQSRLEETVRVALEDLSHFQPKFTVEPITDAKRMVADLEVTIDEEGVRGTLAEVEMTGLRTNTRAEVLDYLKLKPGLPLPPHLATEVATQLWRSARFVHHDVTLQELPETGKFKLELDLEELRGAPSLGQELSPEARAMLKFREWLEDWSKGQEDLSGSIETSLPGQGVHVDLALSAEGFAIAGRSKADRGQSQLGYALVASKQRAGFYSLWRREKYSVPDPIGAVLKVSIIPKNISISGGATSSGELSVKLELTPAACLDLLYRSDAEVALRDDVLHLTYVGDECRVELRINAKTGHLIQCVQTAEGWTLRLHPDPGSFTRLSNQVSVVSADHPNVYDGARPLSSWVGFMAADLLESSWTDLVLEQLAKSAAAEGTGQDILTQLRQAKVSLALAHGLLGKQRLVKVFDPLNRVLRRIMDMPERPGAERERKETKRDVEFLVLSEGPLTQADAMGGIASLFLAQVDLVGTRGSWVWTVSREALFSVAGQGRYTGVEFEKLLKSDEAGPVACLATALLLGRGNPRAARAFAERGLSRLSSAALRLDYQAAFENQSILAEMVGNGLALFRDLTEPQVALLTATLPGAPAAWFRDSARLARATKDPSLAQAVWPALEQHWDDVTRPFLASALNRFLPQVQFLSDPKALYARGLQLTAPNTVFRDFDEAAQCFRKAAEMGHGGAQLQLGLLFERGEGLRQDYAQALRWYQKAAALKEPHADCRLGVLYRDGLGVEKDLDKAFRLLRVGAEAGCTAAQRELGRTCEELLNIAEALQWYRRAAESGENGSQARLGDLLSDGISTSPDYVEACQWLILASGKEDDRLSQIRLRRVKAKLTTEQLSQAQDRADAVTHQLELKEKAKKPASTPH